MTSAKTRCSGPTQGGSAPFLYLSRVPFADLAATTQPSLAGVQWWTSSGWRSDPPPSSLSSIYTGRDTADGDWGFYKRQSDGMWVRFQIYQSGPTAGDIMYDVARNLTDPIKGDGMVADAPPSPHGFAVPEGARRYMAVPHPEQTWSGKRRDDVLITWCDTGDATYGDMRLYWPFLTKVAL